MRGLAAAFAAFMATAVALPAGATPVERWTVSGASGFEAGELEGLMIGPSGNLLPGPRAELISEIGAEYIWDIAVSEGDIFAGTGDGATLRRIGADLKGETVWEGKDLEIYCVTRGGDGRIWFGTSPGGRVVALDPTGRDETSEWIIPDSYVWEILPSEGGTFIATGSDETEGGGAIHLLRDDGGIEELFRTKEPHILSLALLPGGELVFGTQGSQGLVESLDREGSLSVLFDPPETEIADIEIGRGGDIFILALSGEGGGGENSSRIYRIGPDGIPDLFYETSEGIRAIEVRGDAVWAALSEGGRIISVERPGMASTIIDLDAENILCMEGNLIGTGLPAALFEVTTRRPDEGIYTSEVIDAGTVSRWGSVDFSYEGSIAIETRSGNTSVPDETWSDWSEPLTERYSEVASPAARFLQLRARLSRAEGSEEPVIRSLSVAFHAANRSPRLGSLEVVGLIEAVESNPQALAQAGPMGAGIQQVIQLFRGQARDRRMGGILSSMEGFLDPFRPYFVAAWESSDPDGDPLRAALSIREEGDGDWRTIEERLDASAYLLDGASLPEGTYRMRVLVDDAEGNTPGDSRTVSMISEPFIVDHLPPSFEVSVIRNEEGVRIEGTVFDSVSPIERIEYMVDLGEWIPLPPEDGIADSPGEGVRLHIEVPDAGPHVVVLRALDSRGNTGFSRIAVPASNRAE